MSYWDEPGYTAHNPKITEWWTEMKQSRSLSPQDTEGKAEGPTGEGSERVFAEELGSLVS